MNIPCQLDKETKNGIPQHTYKIIQADSTKGGFAKKLVGCTVRNVRFTQYEDNVYICEFTVIKTPEDNFHLRDIHTSPVEQIWQQANTLYIKTQNTLYLLEETAPVQFAPIQATNLVELYLVDGVFFEGFFYDETGNAQPLKAVTHTGMFTDSYLICGQKENFPFYCRYFLQFDKIDFYGKESFCRPILVHNIGTSSLTVCRKDFSAQLYAKEKMYLYPTSAQTDD